MTYTQRTTCAIPHDIQRWDGRPLEVLLFVSPDRGTRWSLYATQTASPGQFLFRAARDGEYWFASATINPGVAYPPTDGMRPQQRVVVDTVEPKLNATAVLSPKGELVVTWDAFDENLAPASLTVEWQPDADQLWKPVAIDRSGIPATGPTFRGRTAWLPEPGPRTASVRVTIRDFAQHASQVTRRVAVPANLPAPPTASPVAASPAVPPDPFAQIGLSPDTNPKPPTPPPDGTAEKPAAKPAQPAPQGVAWPSDKAPANGFTSTQTYRPFSSPGSTPVIQTPQIAQPLSAGVSASMASAHHPTSAGDPAAKSAGTGPTGQVTDQPSNFSLPPGERPHMTRTKSFNLDFSIDAVGPAGLEKVEFWVTRNGGRDWQLWDSDRVGKSPHRVDVESEGLYGFRIVIVGKNGLASPTPRSGDLADLWVGVDTTPPTATILSAAYGADEHAGQLDIRWNANDANLAARPITLLFSDSLSGNWSTIASGLPNTGQYYWRVDARIPDKFYLRLEVRDEAGNATTHQLSEPILSNGLVPKGRIQGLEPVGK
ncbi:MAG: hypothetical protein NTY19_22915 [Planctomycetota bacterium]|nr:hypothetical protein [Planctomycetota bacterium]